MNKHLNWDGRNRNGIISNDIYDGCLFVGMALKPEMSFIYTDFSYSEEFDGQNYIIDASGPRDLSASEIVEIQAKIESWEQELGQEGNPTEEQIVSMKMNNTLMGEGMISALNQMIVSLGGAAVQVPVNQDIASYTNEEKIIAIQILTERITNVRGFM